MNPPSDWSMPTKLHTLELYVDSDQALALLTALVKSSANTLKHLTLQAYNLTDAKLADTLAPVSQTLTSLHYSLGESNSGAFTAVPTLLAPLRRLRHARLPIDSLDLEGTQSYLQGPGPFPKLEVFDQEESGAVNVGELAALLERSKVERLLLPQSWWEGQMDAEVDRASLEGETESEVNTSMVMVVEGWYSRVEGLVGTLELV